MSGLSLSNRQFRPGRLGSAEVVVTLLQLCDMRCCTETCWRDWDGTLRMAGGRLRRTLCKGRSVSRPTQMDPRESGDDIEIVPE